jgi:hypothetical protein
VTTSTQRCPLLVVYGTLNGGHARRVSDDPLPRMRRNVSVLVRITYEHGLRNSIGVWVCGGVCHNFVPMHALLGHALAAAPHKGTFLWRTRVRVPRMLAHL